MQSRAIQCPGTPVMLSNAASRTVKDTLAGVCQYSPLDNRSQDARCNYCLDRFTEGELPNCVEARPVRALDGGPLEKLEESSGTIKEAEGFKYSTRTKPAVVIKAKRRG